MGVLGRVIGQVRVLAAVILDEVGRRCIDDSCVHRGAMERARAVPPGSGHDNLTIRSRYDERNKEGS